MIHVLQPEARGRRFVEPALQATQGALKSRWSLVEILGNCLDIAWACPGVVCVAGSLGRYVGHLGAECTGGSGPARPFLYAQDTTHHYSSYIS